MKRFFRSLYLSAAVHFHSWRYRRALSKLTIEQKVALVAESVVAGNSTVIDPSQPLADEIYVGQQMTAPSTSPWIQ